MKKLNVVALSLLVSCTVYAMPTNKDISDARPIVAELMSPVVGQYKAKTKTAVEVADVSVSYADTAKNEAVRFLFLRGAVGYYVKGGEYGKAADVMDKLKANFTLPPNEVAKIISNAFDNSDMQKSPRLYSLFMLARAQVMAGRDVRRLASHLKKVRTDAIRRRYAEALALSVNWKTALAEFAKVSGETGIMARSDVDGSGKAVALGDFWWDYDPAYEGGEPLFRDRAASFYRKAIAEGKVDGLKKTLVERRLASLVLADVDSGVSSSGNSRPSGGSTATAARATKDKSGLLHRWSFTDNMVDSVDHMSPSSSKDAQVVNGSVSVKSGSPLEFSAGAVPVPPFTVQVWASGSGKDLARGNDMILKIAPSADDVSHAVYWRWTAGNSWASTVGNVGAAKKTTYGQQLINGQKRLFTVVGEKTPSGLSVKYFLGDTCQCTLVANPAWTKPQMLILGGTVNAVYDEVRVYSRALSHAEIVDSLNLGPDKMP